MSHLTTFLVLCLAVAALGKVRTSKRPGFMMGNPLYDPVWEDDSKIVGGNEVMPGSRPYQLSFQYQFGFHFCGAIAYTTDFAITAAHCCEGQSANSLRVCTKISLTIQLKIIKWVFVALLGPGKIHKNFRHEG